MTEATTSSVRSEDQWSVLADVPILARTRFDEVPRTLQRRVFGVPYVELGDASGGTLWVTRHGWNFLEHLVPAQWFGSRHYDRAGERMSKGSGAVFRVSSEVAAKGSVNLVVKFSRMAQDLPLQVSSRFPDGLPRHVLDESDFNDPFQEFGLLEELRTTQFGPANLRVRTKRPLAIYSPGRRFQAWQLGRSAERFRTHSRRLADDQNGLEGRLPAVEMSLDRQYITLFHWVRGTDAEVLMEAGLISAAETGELVRQVMDDLAAKGFRVLDTKPNHVILRQRPNGRLLTRGGRLVYAIVDFELLQRTQEYRDWRESQRRVPATI